MGEGDTQGDTHKVRKFCAISDGKANPWEIKHNLDTTQAYVYNLPRRFKALPGAPIDIGDAIEFVDENTVVLHLTEPLPEGWEVTIVG